MFVSKLVGKSLNNRSLHVYNLSWLTSESKNVLLKNFSIKRIQFFHSFIIYLLNNLRRTRPAFYKIRSNSRFKSFFCKSLNMVRLLISVILKIGAKIAGQKNWVKQKIWFHPIFFKGTS